LNEQAAAVFVDEVETIINEGHPQTAPWIQAQIFLFQYNVNVGYLVQVSNGITIGYADIVPADRIISNCAVVPNSSGNIKIKVTTGSPAGALNANQVIALQSYLTNFLAPNQQYQIITVAGDKLWLAGTVYYNGQLNAAIQANVIAVINDYLTLFSTSQNAGGSFNGLAKISDIDQIILAVPGVVDWVPSQMTITPVVGVPTNLIIASTVLQRSYQAYSGYLIEDPAQLFSATINFVPATN
jgi:hypothetical protein